MHAITVWQDPALLELIKIALEQNRDLRIAIEALAAASPVLAEAVPVGATVADLGSGAGLPGLVLAIVRPDLKVTLVEWMDKLFSGPWDQEYYARRARIGRVHVRIALPQHYMLGAMNVVRLEFLRVFGVTPSRFNADVNASGLPAPSPGRGSPIRPWRRHRQRLSSAAADHGPRAMSSVRDQSS